MRFLSVALTLAALALPSIGSAENSTAAAKPTIVLVHGAFAESSSWSDVIGRLQNDGYKVIAAANPLRGVRSDGQSVAALVRAIDGPVVLVGHSYGGPVITEAADGSDNVKALVYVAGFLPSPGESSASLSEKFPGSTLGSALSPVTLPDGGRDLFIDPAKFRAQFAADVPAARAVAMAATQRPIAEAALQEPTRLATWLRLPSYVIYGSDDRNIPAAVMKFMADRAHARKTVVVAGASHALMISHPAEVTTLIEQAAGSE